jgi:hypothetical protein
MASVCHHDMEALKSFMAAGYWRLVALPGLPACSSAADRPEAGAMLFHAGLGPRSALAARSRRRRDAAGRTRPGPRRPVLPHPPELQLRLDIRPGVALPPLTADHPVRQHGLHNVVRSTSPEADWPSGARRCRDELTRIGRGLSPFVVRPGGRTATLSQEVRSVEFEYEQIFVTSRVFSGNYGLLRQVSCLLPSSDTTCTRCDAILRLAMPATQAGATALACATAPSPAAASAITWAQSRRRQEGYPASQPVVVVRGSVPTAPSPGAGHGWPARLDAAGEAPLPSWHRRPWPGSRPGGRAVLVRLLAHDHRVRTRDHRVAAAREGSALCSFSQQGRS